MLDTLLVGIIVALAAFHVARRYLPRTWRRRLQRDGGVAAAEAPGCATACRTCNGCGSASRSR